MENEMLNVRKNRLSTCLFITAMCACTFSVAIGFVVLVGWYINSETLVQIIPTFVPMQYNTALGFLLCGSGLSLAIFKKHYSTAILGSLPIVIGGLTLFEYSMGMNLGIDELFMKHTITVKTSHPGRMAPNTATCFILIGSVLLFHVFFMKRIYKYLLEAVFASLAFGLGVVALSGYIIHLETTYAWGNLTAMAVHTSIGFIVLSVGALALIWRDDLINEIMPPRWLAVPTVICTMTVTICFWQALQTEYASIAKQSDVPVLTGLSRLSSAILVSGVLLAIALALAVYFAQISIRRTKEIIKANQILTDEITERKQAEELLQERTHFAELGADIGIVLTKGDTLRSILCECTEAMIRHLDVAFARIWTLNEEENMLELQASSGMYTHIDGPHSRVPVGSLKIGLIAQEHKPHLTNDVITDPRVSDKEWAKREGIVSFAGYPHHCRR